MATRTRSRPDRTPLVSYLRVQQNLDREVLALLRSANESITAELRRLEGRSRVGGRMRREQLAATQAALHRHNATLFARLGDRLAAAREIAAAEAVEATFPMALLGSVFPAEDVDYMLRSARATASRGIESVEARLRISAIPLSERVYHTRNLVDGTIDRIVNDALARGASAAELAKDVRSYIRPDTPGGTRYAANRLARTELNNAFHAIQVEQGIKEPWTTAVRWNLSGSHPRPDECNEYAEQVHFEGGEAGLWRPEDVPAKPHPNCLCYTTPEPVSREEFIRQYTSGAYDSYLDREFPGLPARPIS